MYNPDGKVLFIRDVFLSDVTSPPVLEALCVQEALCHNAGTNTGTNADANTDIDICQCGKPSNDNYFIVNQISKISERFIYHSYLNLYFCSWSCVYEYINNNFNWLNKVMYVENTTFYKSRCM